MDEALDSRSSGRYVGVIPSKRFVNIGFRVVRELESPATVSVSSSPSKTSPSEPALKPTQPQQPTKVDATITNSIGMKVEADPGR